MRTNYAHCPNPDCSYHNEAPARWYWRKGTFVARRNRQPVPRFQCKRCRRTFSSHTFRPIYRQKKPYLNESLRKILAESATVRGSARALETSKSTVLRKLKFLGELSRKTCEEMRKRSESKTSYVQFDEMETFHRTQLLPLTIAFAIRPKTGEIISAHIGTTTPRNLKRLSERKYGTRERESERAVRAMLKDVKEVVRDCRDFSIISDRWQEYRVWVNEELPFAKYENFSGTELRQREKAMSQVDSDFVDFSATENSGNYWIRIQKNGKRVVKAYDPLFHINQKCQRLRAAFSRLRKNWWGYTQKIEFLEHHLWLFIAVNNGYRLRY